jgi:uncharacterized protein YgiM (DUF1202 family)
MSKNKIVLLSACSALLLAGCQNIRFNPSEAQKVIERVGQAPTETSAKAAEKPAAAEATAAPVSAQATTAPAPQTQDVVLVRCLVQAEKSVLRTEPNEASLLVAELGKGEVLTGTGRSEDSKWLLGYRVDNARGWMDASTVGCSAPVGELVVASNNVLNATTKEVVAEATPTTSNVAASTTATETMTNTATLPAVSSGGESKSELSCVVTGRLPVNVRRGPATSYRRIALLRPKTTFMVTARNEKGDWLYGSLRRISGWMIAENLQCDGDVNALPIK